MKIAVAADHAGFEMKQKVLEMIRALGHDVEDGGTCDTESVDYPDFASKVAAAVADGGAERGVLVCATGIGMSIAANRVKGVRAALCSDVHAAEMSRRHNNANVLCLGGQVQSWDEVAAIVAAWLDTPFEGGRHQRRVEKLDAV
jgi:ribose 5-phosphate isomerase B